MPDASKKLNEVRTGQYPLALATSMPLPLMARTLIVECWGKLGWGGLSSKQEMRRWRQSTDNPLYKSYCKKER